MKISHRTKARSLALKCRANMRSFHRIVVVPLRAGERKSAVRRNRLRRIGRELFRQIKPLGAVEGQDIALFIYPTAMEMSFATLLDDFCSLFRRCRLL